MTSRKSATKAPQPARDINRTQKILAAQQLRIAGYEWDEIATTLSIKGGKGAAYNLVNNALIKALREGDKAMRELENRRLDALHRVYWPKALDGDGWSHDRILRQMERRAALNGLDRKDDAGESTLPTVVREAYPVTWIEGLAALAQPTTTPAAQDGGEPQ